METNSATDNPMRQLNACTTRAECSGPDDIEKSALPKLTNIASKTKTISGFMQASFWIPVPRAESWL